MRTNIAVCATQLALWWQARFSVAHPRKCSRGRVRGALAAVLALVGAGSVAASDNDVLGNWLSPPDDNWPLVALHAVLTPDGRILSYGSNNAGANTVQTGFLIYDVWDPAEGLSGGHLTLDNRTLTDLFCSAQVLLPQSGDVFLAGGDIGTGKGVKNAGNPNTNLFRSTDNTLFRANDMNRARWYATTTVLANGEIYIQGGRDRNKVGVTAVEVRDANGNFRLLTDIQTGAVDWFYPRNFLAPDGRVFGFDRYGVMYYVTTAGTGSLTMAGNLPSGSRGREGSAAMFGPGKILQLSGKSTKAYVIDINGSIPQVSATQSMSSVRKWMTATILADGRVLATGGSSVNNELVDVNNTAAIWDPDTGQWTIGRSGARPRLYHSTALMLPDASVLVAGGGAPGPVINLHAEIYYPPYLYNSSGDFASRPNIDSAPATLNIDDTFSVDVGGTTISRVTLVKTGAVTHSFNMDQRFLELSFTDTAGTLFVQTPSNPNIAPPGYYLLFVFDNQGVPSVGKIVRMNID